jgi:predicted PurR-regulated permease PerM
MLIHGASATTAFALLGMHYFYLLGVFAGVVNIIPVLGPVITLIVAGAVAAIHSTGKLVGVIIFYVLYHNAENAFLSPRIMEAKVRIPAVTIVVALVIGDGLAGILGILISVPTEYIAHTGVITTDESKPVLAPNRAA